MFELGNNLRDARQRRRIDLVVAEQDTKIRSKYLAALENEEFDVLPGPVFVRGFLRTYARYLGLDAQLFIDEYNTRFGRIDEVDHDHTPQFSRPGIVQERARRGHRIVRAVIILALVAIALLTWRALREPSADRTRPVDERTTATDTVPASTSAPANISTAGTIPAAGHADPATSGSAADAALGKAAHTAAGSTSGHRRTISK